MQIPSPFGFLRKTARFLKENWVLAVGAVGAVIAAVALTGRSNKDEAKSSKDKAVSTTGGFERKICATFENGDGQGLRFLLCDDPEPAESATERSCEPLPAEPAEFSHLFLLSCNDPDTFNLKTIGKYQRYNHLLEYTSVLLIKCGNDYGVYGIKDGKWQVTKLEGVAASKTLEKLFSPASVVPQILAKEDVPAGVIEKIVATGIGSSTTPPITSLLNARAPEKQPFPSGSTHKILNVGAKTDVVEKNGQHVKAPVKVVSVMTDKNMRNFAVDVGRSYVTANADAEKDPKEKFQYSICGAPNRIRFLRVVDDRAAQLAAIAQKNSIKKDKDSYHHQQQPIRRTLKH